jgi:aspartate kinase
MKIFKFGGASVRNAEAIRNLHRIVEPASSSPLVIVVSAMAKSTNQLEEVLGKKRAGKSITQELQEFMNYHLEVCQELFESDDHPIFRKLESLFGLLKQALDGSYGSYDKHYDQVVSHGELFSTAIVNEFLNHSGTKCNLVSAKNLIITDSTFREGLVRWDLTRKAVGQYANAAHHGSLILTQGFIAADEHGNTTTLGREGSDFTAAILASCLDAESVTIWKDVSGVFNADPNSWKHAIKYPSISYGEAAEMTYYGASVIHPKTIRPLAVKGIPLIVRSFIDTQEEGTLITEIRHEALAPAIIFKSNQCLISFHARDFSFINESKVSLIFHLFEQYKIPINMMQSSAISFSVSVDNPDEKLKTIINSLSGEFNIYYNDRLELITVKNYTSETIANAIRGRNILLEQKTRKNYQALVSSHS